MTRAWMCRSFSLIFWMMGIPKAAVLPVPVWAWPIRSSPSRAMGMAPFWMGDGSSKPISFRAARIFRSRFRSSKDVISGLDSAVVFSILLISVMISPYEKQRLSLQLFDPVHGQGQCVHGRPEFNGGPGCLEPAFQDFRSVFVCCTDVHQTYRLGGGSAPGAGNAGDADAQIRSDFSRIPWAISRAVCSLTAV